MKVVFVCADKERESILADAFFEGVALYGDEGVKVDKTKDMDFTDGDVFCMVGVKSLKIFRQARDAGKHVVYFDKGYFRHRGPNRTWEYWRVAVNDHHPTDYVGKAVHSPARWEIISKRRVEGFRPWRDSSSPGMVIYAGSSDKYHTFAGLPDPTAYAQDIVAQIRERTERRVIYRPKPTWLEASPVSGAAFSDRNQSLGDLLPRAWCLVTNGSNSAYDAILAGIPAIVLGHGIARPISSTSLDDIECPYLAPDEERLQWFSNLAWCMFTEYEMKIGLAWAAIKPQLYGNLLDESSLKTKAGRSMKPSKAMLKRCGSWPKDKQKTQKKAKKKDYANTELLDGSSGLQEAPSGVQDVLGEVPSETLRPGEVDHSDAPDQDNTRLRLRQRRAIPRTP